MTALAGQVDNCCRALLPLFLAIPVEEEEQPATRAGLCQYAARVYLSQRTLEPHVGMRGLAGLAGLVESSGLLGQATGKVQGVICRWRSVMAWAA